MAKGPPSSTPHPDDPDTTDAGTIDPDNAAALKARHLLERSLELLWEGRPPTTKGPKPTLTLGEIVDAAIGIADADGLEALSMRRLARELDMGTMSLYRYVPDKSVLLDQMLDRVSTPSPRADRDMTGRRWREVLEIAARVARDRYLEHQWLLYVNWARPVLGPNSIGDLENVMSNLTDLPLSDREKVMIISALDAYVNGSVRQQLMYEQAADETGLTEDEFWTAQIPVLERAMASGNYPTMANVADDTFEAGWDETFTIGLERLLDGLAVDVERRSARG